MTIAELIGNQYKTGILISTILSLLIVYGSAIFGSLIVYLLDYKVGAFIQQRVGPSTAGKHGSLQPFADIVKLLFKKNIQGKLINKLVYFLPSFVLGVNLSMFSLIPLGKGVVISTFDYSLLIVAISLLISFSCKIIMGLNKSNVSLITAFRYLSQMFVVICPVFFVIISVVAKTGKLGFVEILNAQGGNVWQWLMFSNPFMLLSSLVFAFSLLIIFSMSPFDIDTEESDIGSDVRFSFGGIDLLFIRLSKYLGVFLGAMLFVVVFCGGSNLIFNLNIKPFGLRNFMGWLTVFTKAVLFSFVFIWIKHSMPRMRNDQILKYSVKILFPASLISIVGTIVWMVIFNG